MSELKNCSTYERKYYNVPLNLMLISPKSRELHKISDSKVSYGITETSLDLCSGTVLIC